MAAVIPREREIIPNQLHFIWFGDSIPDFARIAVISALEKNPGASATLWHDGEFSRSTDLWKLKARGVALRKIDPNALFSELAETAPELPAGDLKRLYVELTTPAAKANMIRLVVLYLHGGIYLDTDTLTLKSFAPLRKLSAFCGEEPTLWPAGTALLDPRALVMSEVRRVCSLWPRGFRFHNRMLRHFTMAANNAVVGARARHPFFAAMLARAASLPESQRKRRYRLGTHLLQETLREFKTRPCPPEDRMTVLSSRHFYPLGPEISRHYFRRYADPRAISDEVLSDETYAIHWYASVSDLRARDDHFIRETANENLYSALCRRHVSDPQLAPAQTRAVAPA